MKHKFTNSKPNHSLSIINKSEITFDKCFFKLGKEIAGDISFNVEFKIPTGSIDKNNNPRYKIITKPICITGFITLMNNPVVIMDKSIDIPKGSTFINISFNNHLDYKFDLELYFSIE